MIIEKEMDGILEGKQCDCKIFDKMSSFQTGKSLELIQQLNDLVNKN